ncbi:MAG: SUMF1/EgtB/PvdO family nonheme iron enzyme [Saprospiraceae bacterium]
MFFKNLFPKASVASKIVLLPLLIGGSCQNNSNPPKNTAPAANPPAESPATVAPPAANPGTVTSANDYIPASQELAAKPMPARETPQLPPDAKLEVGGAPVVQTAADKAAANREPLQFDYPMVRVQGGAFTMGDAKGRPDECPYPANVGNFSIGKYEVTQAQWRAVMGTNPAQFAGCDNCPIETVGWKDVQAFIQKLNARTGRKFRLPTEIEWEYAARGGAMSKNYKYAGSNDPSSVAWFAKNAGKKTHPVGQKQANELGLHDMSGNVWEWCQDNYKPYPCASGSEVPNWVMRGGSLKYEADACRTTARTKYEPDDWGNQFIGLRLAE